MIKPLPIKIYNTLTRKKELFRPIHKKSVGLYTCGPTVYNIAHIGNLRTFVFEDVLKRTLQFAGYRVTHIMNITDVDDKTIAAAHKESVALKKLTRRHEVIFKKDLRLLNVVFPTKFTRATEHVPHMLKDIARLMKRGLAYVKDGSVYFDISKFTQYGKLAHLDHVELMEGPRVDQDEYSKKDARDFVLWKAKKSGEPSWYSLFGDGRPGWHIECSTMATKYLGQPFDIHAGGIDLIFPHHENEIAQAEGANAKPFVKYWMHGEHLLVANQKMAKSLGNFFTLRDIEAEKMSALAFRYLILGTHYRSPLNFTWEGLSGAEHSLSRVYDFVRLLKRAKKKPATVKNTAALDTYRIAFRAAIADDLNTSRALGVLWELMKDYHKDPSRFSPSKTREIVFSFDEVLGLKLRSSKREKVPHEVLNLVHKRQKARQNKDFTKADEMRRRIESLGWSLEDTHDGPQLKKYN